MDIEGMILNEQSQSQKVSWSVIPFIITFSKWQNHRDREQVASCYRCWCGRWDYKEGAWGRSLPWCNTFVSWLWWWLHGSTHVVLWQRMTQKYFTNINFLFLIFYSNFAVLNNLELNKVYIIICKKLKCGKSTNGLST